MTFYSIMESTSHLGKMARTSAKSENPNAPVHSFFLYKNVVFPAQAEYPYFFADFRLKIFLYYS